MPEVSSLAAWPTSLLSVCLLLPAVCVCVCACVHVRVHKCVHTCVCVRVHVCVRVYGGEDGCEAGTSCLGRNGEDVLGDNDEKPSGC